MSQETILEVKDLSKSFGGNTAVYHVDLKVSQGELSSIIGPNGAGKTTLFNLISGYHSANTGQIIFRGMDITGLPADKIVKLGLGRSFQKTNIFLGLTVFGNVQAAAIARQRKSFHLFSSASKMADLNQKVMDTIQEVGLGEQQNILAHSLSHGDRKLLEIAIVLALEPHILLLDEPTAGMSPEETERTVRLLIRLSKEMGLTILFTEHDMDIVFLISGKIRVMHQGRIIAEGTPESISMNRQVREAYLGEED